MVKVCTSTILAVVVAVSAMAPSTTTAGASCPPYECGQDVDIRYPFWVDDGNGTSGASHCGYASLRLECRGSTPVLPLPSGDYGVTRILYGDDDSAGDRTVRVFDLRTSGQNGSCPDVAGHSLTLPPGSPPPLSLTNPDSNLTFLLGCRNEGIAVGHIVRCLPNGKNQYYVVRDGRSLPHDAARYCREVVSMPVLNPADDVAAALRTGFDLTWRPPAGGDCGSYERAGGLCGQRREVAGRWSFTCRDTNATSSPSKSSCSGGRKLTAGLIIALSAMGSVLMMGGIAICLVCWVKKWQSEANSP